MNEDLWAPHERGRATIFAVLVMGAMLWPLRQHLRPTERRVDGFPLSYYPMFSKRRRQHAHVVYAVGILADDSRRRLRHSVLGSGGLNQVRHQLYRVAITEDHAQQYADALAPRLAANPSCDDLVRVEIVRGEFDLDTCLLDHQVEGTETVLATADIPRDPVAPVVVESAERTPA
jgi:hypothetical protein